MKKQIITKVLFACFVMAMSGFVLNLQAQDVVVEFTNPDGLDYGSSNDGFDGTGLGGDLDDAVEDPYVELKFTIGATGQIALDVGTATAYQPVVDVLKTWNNAAIGATANSDLFGKSFSLFITAESRMQLGKDVDGNRGGLGVRGRNQRRIDDEGDNTEWMEFELAGEVGIDFVRFGYNDVSGGDIAHAAIKDWDTDKVWPITDGVDGDPHPAELYLDMSEYNMRYFTDVLTFSTDPDSANTGYRIYSLEFNVVAAEPKPPAVKSSTPERGDSLSFTVTDDLVLEFDAPMDQAATSAAISIKDTLTMTDIPNRADTWSAEGDVLTITHDPLEFATWYEVVVGAGTLGANGKNIDGEDKFIFKTLPEPPSVASTFPEPLAVEVPIDSPISITFTKSMIDTTVNKAISFNPELTINSFVWNGDMTTVFLSTDEMIPSTMYFGTVGTGAADDFGTQLVEPHIFAFTTSIATSVEDMKASDVVLYPNPATDLLEISGMDVASVKIYSVTGQMVKEVQNSTVVNVSDIETGIYVVDVKDRQNKSYKQLILIK